MALNSRCPGCHHNPGPEDFDAAGNLACRTCAARAGNPHERAARLTKVARLVDVIDRHVLDAGLNPHTRASVIYTASASWTEEMWAGFAREAGVNEASFQTRVAVRERYSARCAATVQGKKS
jgi:hypothetical protein